MKECTISIKAPENMLKGAGILNTSFVPSYIYSFNIELKNNTNIKKICSMSSSLGNGVRYLNNLILTGPDKEILDKVTIVEPSSQIGNDNVIVFANNFTLSPNSINNITFDIALCDKLTINSKENTGEKLPHKSKVNYCAHLINVDTVDSCKAKSYVYDFVIDATCDNETISAGDTTKLYVHCNSGQYDMTRSVYLRCILDEGLEFVGDSSNIQPRNIYPFNGKTILKWDVGSLQPSESRRIGFMVKVKKDVEKGSVLNVKMNSNCINNAEYTQCPYSTQCSLIVE